VQPGVVAIDGKGHWPDWPAPIFVGFEQEARAVMSVRALFAFLVVGFNALAHVIIGFP
jgi:hypothetical protein